MVIFHEIHRKKLFNCTISVINCWWIRRDTFDCIIVIHLVKPFRRKGLFVLDVGHFVMHSHESTAVLVTIAANYPIAANYQLHTRYVHLCSIAVQFFQFV